MTTAPPNIAPYWQRLGPIFLYPTYPMLLGTIALFSFARIVAGVLPGLLGSLAGLVLWAMAIKLGCEALENTARGRIDPADENLSMASDGDARDLIILMFLFNAFPLAIGQFFGIWPALLLTVIVTVVLPAATALVVIDKNLAYALNPVAWLALIARLGKDYFGVVLLLVAAQTLSSALISLLYRIAPAWLAGAIGFFFVQYTLIAGCHLIGYLIYQHHEDIGLDIAPALVRPQLASSEEDQAAAEADALAAQGRTAEAAARLESLIAERGASAPIHERYRKLLIAEKDTLRLSRHTRDYVAILLGRDDSKRALAIVGEALQLDPAFRLDDPADITRLLAHAAESGHSETALRLAVDFHNRFPKSKDIVQNYLHVAKLLAEKQGKETQAKALLTQLQQRFPDHPLSEQIRAYAVQVDQMLAISAGAASRAGKTG